MPTLSSHLLWQHNWSHSSGIYNTRGMLLYSSFNVMYAILCQQCLSTLYVGQTGHFLHKIINGHKSYFKNGNTLKTVSEDFSLPEHLLYDLWGLGKNTTEPDLKDNQL